MNNRSYNQHSLRSKAVLLDRILHQVQKAEGQLGQSGSDGSSDEEVPVHQVLTQRGSDFSFLLGTVGERHNGKRFVLLLCAGVSAMLTTDV